jgi:hypothetical protein
MRLDPPPSKVELVKESRADFIWKSWLNNLFVNADARLIPIGGTAGQVLRKIDATDFNTEWGTVSGGSGISRQINSVAVNTTAGSTAATDYVYFCSSTMTLTLPTAVGNTNLYVAKNSGVGTITVNTTGGQTIDGSASVTMAVANTALAFVSNNSNWMIV